MTKARRGHTVDFRIPQFTARPFFRPANARLRFLPEGPRVLRNYPGGGSKLGWVAIQHGAASGEGSINVLDLSSGKNSSFALSGRPGFFAETDRPGVVLIGLERSLVCFNLLTGALDAGPTVTDDERVIINDGLAVEGGVFFGTKHLKFTEAIASLYFFDTAARRVHTLLGGQICSNGKFLRHDAGGTELIDVDSMPRTISRYRLDAQRRVLGQSQVRGVGSLPGFPDGMRPAPDGNSVIVAFYNPGAVATGVARQLRLADGAILCEWRIPGAPRVTCPEFLEIKGKIKLLFTTAVEGMPAATRRRAPESGTMYLADTPFDGMPEPPPLVQI
jgi:sugar lactone lactonase YvrE